MRLFIAIDIDSYAEFFKGIQKNIDATLGKFGFTKSYHLTLKFLGEVEDKNLENIKERLKKIRFLPFEIAIVNIGVFPDWNHVKVIWAGIEENTMLMELQKKIERALEDLFPAEKRFHPHITLARVRIVKDKKGLRDNLGDIDFEKKHFTVNNFKLIKSTLTTEGPVYDDLAIYEA